MTQRLPYDATLQMLVEPPIEWNDEIINRLRFMRWMMEHNPQSVNDGRVEGKSDGPVIDFLAEKAKREAEEQTIAA